MEDNVNTIFPTAITIEALFRDTYRILEEIQEAPEHVDSISGVLVHCHRTIRNLERIHQNQVRLRGAEAAQDPFDLRGTLDRFITTCNTLNYVLTPVLYSPASECFFGLRWTWKRKQISTLEEEILGHRRMLSLVLTNAMYTTTLEMQTQTQNHDRNLAFILRQVERRHNIYERRENPATVTSHQKLTKDRENEMAWELCLRRYFDYAEVYCTSRAQNAAQDTSKPYYHPRPLGSGEPARETPFASTTSFSYGSYRRGDGGETAHYSNTWEAQVHGAMQRNYTRSRRSSITSNSSGCSTTPYDRQVVQVQASRLPPSRDSIQWERMATGMTNRALDPLAITHPELEQARQDIMTETRNMSAAEIRAYVQGRLASLDSKLTEEIRRVLVGDQPARSSVIGSDRNGAQIALTKRASQTSLERYPMSSDSIKPQSTRRTDSSNSLPKETESKQQKPARKRESINPEDPNQQRRSAKQRLLSLQAKAQRPLSAIQERPRTAKSSKSAKSKASKAESILSKRSFFSTKEKPPSLPKFLEVSDNTVMSSFEKESLISLSKSSTSSHSKEMALKKLPTVPPTEKRPKSALKSAMKQQACTSKPLPPKPNEIVIKPRLFKFRMRQRKSKVTPSIASSKQGSIKSSMATPSRVSLNFSHRNESKSTLRLFAVQDGLEKPFEVWLRALPYIEGRAGTPKGFKEIN